MGREFTKWEDVENDFYTPEEIAESDLRVALVARKSFAHKTLEERIAESGVPLELSPELDWGESRGNEVW